MPTGKFIVFEGLDGCGKSTQIRLLTSHFEKTGRECQYIHFPRFSGAFFAEMISRFLRGELGTVPEVPPEFVAMLYAGDRADAKLLLKHWLDRGLYVIADRYVYSNVAFQVAKIEEEERKRKLKRWIEDLEFEYFGVPRPDVSLYLQVPLEIVREHLAQDRVGHERQYLNGKADIHESSLELQKSVEAEYSALCDERSDIVRILCAEGGKLLQPSDIHRKILHMLNL